MADGVCVGVATLDEDVVLAELTPDTDALLETLELLLVNVDVLEVVAGTKTVTVMVTAPLSPGWLLPCSATVGVGIGVSVQSVLHSARFPTSWNDWSSVGFPSSGRATARTWV